LLDLGIEPVEDAPALLWIRLFPELELDSHLALV
jgi:hypothetical protein